MNLIFISDFFPHFLLIGKSNNRLIQGRVNIADRIDQINQIPVFFPDLFLAVSGYVDRNNIFLRDEHRTLFDQATTDRLQLLDVQMFI